MNQELIWLAQELKINPRSYGYNMELAGAIAAAFRKLEQNASNQSSLVARHVRAIEEARPLCPDHRDKQRGKECLACRIETLERQKRELIEILTRIVNSRGMMPCGGYHLVESDKLRVARYLVAARSKEP